MICSACLHYFKPFCFWRQKAKKKTPQTTTKAANTINSFQYALSKKQWNKRETKALNRFQHATLFHGQIFFHRKPTISLVYSHKNRRLFFINQAERESSKTKKPHDIFTSPCTWLQTEPTHTASHAIHTHTHPHTVCKTKQIEININPKHFPESIMFWLNQSPTKKYLTF